MSYTQEKLQKKQCFIFYSVKMKQQNLKYIFGEAYDFRECER